MFSTHGRCNVAVGFVVCSVNVCNTVIPMKMFPHTFAPFFHLHGSDVALKDNALGTVAEASPRQDRAIRKKPVIVDVEKAVAVMLFTSSVKNKTIRDQFRVAVINALPADQIDWDSINWVQLCPFRSVRR